MIDRNCILQGFYQRILSYNSWKIVWTIFACRYYKIIHIIPRTYFYKDNILNADNGISTYKKIIQSGKLIFLNWFFFIINHLYTVLFIEIWLTLPGYFSWKNQQWTCAIFTKRLWKYSPEYWNISERLFSTSTWLYWLD